MCVHPMTEISFAELEQRLQKHGQQHLLNFVDELTSEDRDELFRQIADVDFSLLTTIDGSGENNDVSRIEQAAAPRDVVYQPQTPNDQSVRDAAAETGRTLLSEGRVAVITVAGGQGSRLGFDHPKGMFPIGPRSERTLFQIFAEQIAARRHRHGGPIPWYLMTSATTHDETVEFFRQQKWFGLDPDSVRFFCQASLPAIDAQTHRILMDSPSQLSLSPDGHGGMVTALQKSGALLQMAADGIQHVFYHQVDNPTVILCDPVLVGMHAERESWLTTNVVRKSAPTERMGVLVDIAGRTEIIEYSELTPDQAAATDENGQWVFWAGNTAIHVFRRDFLEYLTEDGVRLPLHQAQKKVSCIDESGRRIDSQEPNAIKFERFIFDALPLADRTLIVEGDRSR